MMGGKATGNDQCDGKCVEINRQFGGLEEQDEMTEQCVAKP